MTSKPKHLRTSLTPERGPGVVSEPDLVNHYKLIQSKDIVRCFLYFLYKTGNLTAHHPYIKKRDDHIQDAMRYFHAQYTASIYSTPRNEKES